MPGDRRCYEPGWRRASAPEEVTMFGMGASELMIILVIILLLFGAAKLPELGRSLGSGLSNFKKGLKDGDEGPTPAPPQSASLPEQAQPVAHVEEAPKA
jgi:sec-independent protein translocase protein TatA